jgi:CheY-like chemotaxis protein
VRSCLLDCARFAEAASILPNHTHFFPTETRVFDRHAEERVFVLLVVGGKEIVSSFFVTPVSPPPSEPGGHIPFGDWRGVPSAHKSKPMAKVTEYYSVKENKKPFNKRVYHDDDQCRAGRDILQSERRNGTGGYRHCDDCTEAALASAAGSWEASVKLPLPENEDSRLESLRSFRILGTSCEQEFDDVVHLAAMMCDAPVAAIAFVDEQTVWFKAKIGLELDEIPRDGSFCGHAILQSDVLMVSDPISDKRFMSSGLVKQIGIQFYAGIPLITADNYPIGTLAVMDRAPHLMTAEQIDFLKTLARRVVQELERRRTTEPQSQKRRLHLEPPRHRSVTVLIVEDDGDLRELLQRALERHGFSVLPAANGAEALRLSEQHDGPIEILVSDIVMPGINGLELSERIRAARRETKFLFITGFGDRFPELHEYGANILEKPFLPSELLHKVEDILSQGKEATGTG